MAADPPPPEADPAAIADEQRRIRRLRFVVDLTASLLAQDPELTPATAAALIARAQEAADALFPGSQATFDLLIRPRFERILFDRFPPEPREVN